MNHRFSYLKGLYQLKQKIDSLSERDKALLLFIVIVGLFVFWYFAFYYSQKQLLIKTNKDINALQAQIGSLTQKKKMITSLVSNPDIAQLITRFNDLTYQTKLLDKELNQYTERYISSRDLSKLLHDMLKQTPEVIIDELSTVTPKATMGPASITEEKPVTTALAVASIHYRLVMRGHYFSIMNYLKLLENLPWQLYWDTFDYHVSNYPEGIVTVEFYTLKPDGSSQQSVIQGASQ